MTQPTSHPRALIADDEPLLVRALSSELAQLWPELVLLDPVGDGQSALESLTLHRPDIAFLDIRMPVMSGLDVAQAMAEEWDDGVAPLLVFVTAHDEHAIAAYELAALDYITKPVRSERLRKTINRLQQALSRNQAPSVDQLAMQLSQILTNAAGAGDLHLPGRASEPPLTVIRASVGDTTRMIPIDQVVMFEAADKYVNVVTNQGDALIRESLRELKPRLDDKAFVQIHRSRIVNLRCVSHAQRGEDGKLRLTLTNRPEQPVVSRVFAHLFKAM